MLWLENLFALLNWLTCGACTCAGVVVGRFFGALCIFASLVNTANGAFGIRRSLYYLAQKYRARALPDKEPFQYEDKDLIVHLVFETNQLVDHFTSDCCQTIVLYTFESCRAYEESAFESLSPVLAGNYKKLEGSQASPDSEGGSNLSETSGNQVTCHQAIERKSRISQLQQCHLVDKAQCNGAFSYLNKDTNNFVAAFVLHPRMDGHTNKSGTTGISVLLKPLAEGQDTKNWPSDSQILKGGTMAMLHEVKVHVWTIPLQVPSLHQYMPEGSETASGGYTVMLKVTNPWLFVDCLTWKYNRSLSLNPAFETLCGGQTKFHNPLIVPPLLS